MNNSHLILPDSKAEYGSEPPEWLGEYLTDSLMVLGEDDQYKFSYLAESREAHKIAGV